MAKEKDPTISSSSNAGDPPVPEAPAVSEADDSAQGKSYSEQPEKPDPTSIAQVEDDPSA